MGYNTHYNLEVDDWVIIYELRKQNENAHDAFDDEGNELEPIPWYSYEEELKEFSKKYPDTLFKLSGEGEEAGDLWICYIKNGKSQRCEAKITYDEFDETKLE